jgi:hypothetical protein
MTNKELNKWLAEEIMEWEATKDSFGDVSWYPDGIMVEFWNPTKDLNQMARCEEKIPEDKYKKYCLTLIDILGIERQSYADECLHYYTALFKFATPNARQRAEALYKTMEG